MSGGKFLEIHRKADNNEQSCGSVQRLWEFILS